MHKKGDIREIHALSYAISELMAALDRYLFDKVSAWKLHRDGLDVLVKSGLKIGERLVFIRPVGWPKESVVVCRFDRALSKFGWVAYKGTVAADHLGVSLEFRANFDPVYGLIISDSEISKKVFH